MSGYPFSLSGRDYEMRWTYDSWICYAEKGRRRIWEMQYVFPGKSGIHLSEPDWKDFAHNRQTDLHLPQIELY